MSAWRSAADRLARMMGLQITFSQVRYYQTLQRNVQPGTRWLDVGCGRQIVPDCDVPLGKQREITARVKLLVGMDVDPAIHDHPLLQERVMGWGDALPFADSSFDLVTANMVMEHVKEPTRILSEVQRVLRPGGQFIFHTPNFKYYLIFIAWLLPDFIKQKIIWLLERRAEEDIFPTYYRFNTSSRVGSLAVQCGLDVKELEVRCSTGSFRSLGPIGVLEVFILKALSLPLLQDFGTTLIAVLVKPPRKTETPESVLKRSESPRTHAP